jgi:hypothetical protein
MPLLTSSTFSQSLIYCLLCTEWDILLPVGEVSRFMIQTAHVGFLHVPIKIGTSTKISPKSKPYSQNFS